MLGAMEPRLRAMIFAFALAPAAAAAAGLPPGFVYLRDIAPGIAQDMRYAGFDNFTGRPLPGYGAPECVLRRDVAQALAKVAGRSRQAAARPQGLRLLSPDARGRGLCALGADGPTTARPSASTPRWKSCRLFSLGYIAAHSAHSTGNAVDLTLVRVADAARRRPSMRARSTAPAPRRRTNARPTIHSTWAPASTASTTKAARPAQRSRPNSSAGALCSLPPCARAASTIISANGGTSVSARAGRLMILRLGARPRAPASAASARSRSRPPASAPAPPGRRRASPVARPWHARRNAG